jgi:DNA replication protein DnaC
VNHISENIRATIERMRAISEDPAYQEQVRRLEAQEADRVAAQAEARRLEYLVHSGIPRICWPHLDAPGDTPAVAAVRELLSPDPHRPSVIILGGPKGRGKTTALAFATHARRGRLVEAQDLFRLSSFAATDWQDLQDTPLLALDEAGTEFLGDVLAVNLFSVLNARIQNLRPTAIATNLSLADFKTRFLRGAMERLDDRFRACGKWVSLPGESLRRHWSEGVEP